MPYDFSFNTRQWWTLLVTCFLILILTLVIGVIAGVMWTRSRGGPVRTGNPAVPMERPDDRGSRPDAVPPPPVDTRR